MGSEMCIRDSLIIGEDAKIVIRELEVVFGLNPIVVQLRFARQLLVLFQHLRGIATRAGIDPVVGQIATAAASATVVVIVTATATTIVVPIAIQGLFASSSLAAD